MAKEKNVSAIVLPIEASSSTEPQMISGIHGRWEPGVPYAPAALGMTLKEARDLIAERNLPLEIQTVSEDSVRQEFDRAEGTYAPSAPARPEDDRVAQAQLEAKTPIGKDGVPLAVGMISSPDTTPDWVKAQEANKVALRAQSEPAGDEPEPEPVAAASDGGSA